MRRSMLRLSAVGALAAVGMSLSACGEDDAVPTPEMPQNRTTYGDDPSQFGDLYLPSSDPRGVVVVIHGGFWSASYDLTLGEPLARSLAEQGWAAWNLEYRRVGNGGGAPATFDDVAAGIDVLANLDLDLTRVITLGHSAGGHLAAWAAGRQRYDWTGGVAATHVISQAGVLDLRASEEERLGGGAAAGLLGHTPTTADESYDPQQQLPLDVPVWCVHARGDTIVPITQSRNYVDAAVAAGARAELVQVDGDHFTVIDPGSEAWTQTLAVLDQIG